MVKNIDPEKWSVRLNLPYYQQEWFSYNFGLGWKDRHGKNRTANSNKIGRVWNIGTGNLTQKLDKMLNSIINGDWEYAGNLYGGLIAFCLKYCKDKIVYYEDKRKKNTVSVSKCCEELRFPTWSMERMNKIFKMQHSFEDFLHIFDDVPHVNFDIDSALMVYKLQGDKAIFSILMQLFYHYKYIDVTKVNLVPELPIIWTPEVSDLVSGTNFPVVATKFSNEFRWERINDGFFLFDEFDNPIDCASIGAFSVFQESLANRLSFLGRCGEWPSYVVCWSWGELVDAVGFFEDDVLVRNLSGGFNRWFKFGLNAEMAVKIKGHKVFSKRGNKEIPGLWVDNRQIQKNSIGLINLAGKRVYKQTNEEVVWNVEEICDWLELGEWCKKKLKYK